MGRRLVVFFSCGAIFSPGAISGRQAGRQAVGLRLVVFFFLGSLFFSRDVFLFFPGCSFFVSCKGLFFSRGVSFFFPGRSFFFLAGGLPRSV